ncbi:Hypothetical Protein FCC1311_005811 [Hondaea fermentalgiana]|uniref:Uncharacterized protein n=1 Tax=Hondaea fermentalgiana TaxID=2315210 RepID=A0A2R5GQ36_9STRA|nr:Hypothetical Protein FCC1311_005811 [Hondaea fermentalgiana]|eukprot:GBG32992.1 Hypothetical Protein FCC1311_005811 [Hondaea fermentalgiana]
MWDEAPLEDDRQLAHEQDDVQGAEDDQAEEIDDVPLVMEETSRQLQRRAWLPERRPTEPLSPEAFLRLYEAERLRRALDSLLSCHKTRAFGSIYLFNVGILVNLYFFCHELVFEVSIVIIIIDIVVVAIIIFIIVVVIDEVVNICVLVVVLFKNCLNVNNISTSPSLVIHSVMVIILRVIFVIIVSGDVWKGCAVAMISPARPGVLMRARTWTWDIGLADDGPCRKARESAVETVKRGRCSAAE